MFSLLSAKKRIGSTVPSSPHSVESIGIFIAIVISLAMIVVVTVFMLGSIDNIGCFCFY